MGDNHDTFPEKDYFTRYPEARPFFDVIPRSRSRDFVLPKGRAIQWPSAQVIWRS
jgi:hypothetical protein